MTKVEKENSDKKVKSPISKQKKLGLIFQLSLFFVVLYLAGLLLNSKITESVFASFHENASSGSSIFVSGGSYESGLLNSKAISRVKLNGYDITLEHFIVHDVFSSVISTKLDKDSLSTLGSVVDLKGKDLVVFSKIGLFGNMSSSLSLESVSLLNSLDIKGLGIVASYDKDGKITVSLALDGLSTDESSPLNRGMNLELAGFNVNLSGDSSLKTDLNVSAKLSKALLSVGNGTSKFEAISLTVMV